MQEVPWTEHHVGRAVTKIPVLTHIELITTVDSSGEGFQTRAYRDGTSIYEGQADEENKAITDAITWVDEHYDIPDSVTFHSRNIGMREGEVHDTRL